MGKIRKPLSQQKGNLTVRQKEALAEQEEMIKTDADQIRRPPAWMKDKAARDEWRRVAPILLSIGVAGNLEKEALEGYCIAYSNWMSASKRIELIKEKEGMEGVPQALVTKWQTFGSEMRRFAEKCGITIDSRLKAASGAQKKQEEKIADEFGDI